MNRILLVIPVVFLFVSTSVHGELCFTGCRFHFCDGRDSFETTSANVPFTGAICSKNNGPRIIEVSDNATCEALVLKGSHFTDISTTGLAPSFFRTTTQDSSITAVMHGDWPGTNAGEYKKKIDGACIVLPLDAWRMKVDATSISDIYTRHSNTEDCVAFKLQA